MKPKEFTVKIMLRRNIQKRTGKRAFTVVMKSVDVHFSNFNCANECYKDLRLSAKENYGISESLEAEK